MATQKIDIGKEANDNKGDPIRTAFIKCNSNFEQIDNNIINITNCSDAISINTANITALNESIALKGNEIDILKKDGSVELNSGYTPVNNLDIATKEYVDAATSDILTNKANILANTSNLENKANDIDVLKKDGSIELNSGYAPINKLDIATKHYVDENIPTPDWNENVSTSKNYISNKPNIDLKANVNEVLLKDGSVELNTGYSPNNNLDIATKKYVDDVASSINGGSGATETDLLTISSDNEKFTGGLDDTKQSDWNTRAKNKIESNTTAIGSKANQTDMNELTSRVSKTEINIKNNTESINGLATVAKSGSYNDLSDTPNIPANTSDIINDSGFVSNLSSFDTDNLKEGSKNLYDKTVSLTGGKDITISGTYPDFTINNTSTENNTSPTMISGGIISNNDLNADKIINITALKCRSDDNTQNIEVTAGSLDITNDTNWADGLVPNLTNATIHIWADYNSGEERFIFDDATGSNINDVKRRVSSFITDANGNIVPFKAYEQSGGGVLILYNNVITDFASTTTGNVKIDLSVPYGIEVGLLAYDIVNSSGGVTIAFKNQTGGDSIKHFNSGWGTMLITEIYTNNASIDINISASLVNHFIDTRGYKDERIK